MITRNQEHLKRRSHPVRRDMAKWFGYIAFVSILVGCRTEVVPIELKFPNQTTFLFSNSVRIAVFDVEPGDRLACSEALTAVEAGDVESAIFDSGLVPACEVHAGNVIVESIPDGPHAFVAVAFGQDDATVFLSGCTVSDVRMTHVIDIPLRTTTHYDENFAAVSPTCTVESRCTEGCVQM